jgi:hypothetical protein
MSSVREAMPSLANTLRRWYSTVFGLTKSCAATALFVAPSRTRRATCSSCGVSSASGLTSRLRAVSPVALSSRRARSAHGCGAEALEAFEGLAQLDARVEAPPLAAQVLAVVQLDPGAVERPCTVERVDRGLEVGLGHRRIGEERPAIRNDGHGPRRRRALRPRREERDCLFGFLDAAGADAGLDAIPGADHAQDPLVVDREQPRQRFLPAADSEVELGEAPRRHAGGKRKPALEGEPQNLLGQASALGLIAAQPRDPG